jgi:hypothetical protein
VCSIASLADKRGLAYTGPRCASNKPGKIGKVPTLYRNDPTAVSLNRTVLFSGVCAVTFQLRNRRPLARKRPSPDSWSPRWRPQSRRCHPAINRSTRSSSTATASRFTWGTSQSRFSPVAATIGPNISGRSPTMRGTSGPVQPSLTARSSFQPRTVPRIFQSFRTN